MPNTQDKSKHPVTDPQAKDVGPFGKANRFLDNLTAGLIIDAAIKELMKREEELRIQMETMDAEEAAFLMPTLIAEQAELEAQWALAAAAFATEDN